MIAAKRPARPLERQLRSMVAKVTLLDAECQVCGGRMHDKFLQPFPGAPDVRACHHCIYETAGVDVDV